MEGKKTPSYNRRNTVLIPFPFLKVDEGSTPELQIRRDVEDNSKIFFLTSQQKHMCDPALVPSWQYGSNDGSQDMFLWRHMANYP